MYLKHSKYAIIFISVKVVPYNYLVKSPHSYIKAKHNNSIYVGGTFLH